jgi:hypothetical protein
LNGGVIIGLPFNALVGFISGLKEFVLQFDTTLRVIRKQSVTKSLQKKAESKLRDNMHEMNDCAVSHSSTSNQSILMNFWMN